MIDKKHAIGQLGLGVLHAPGPVLVEAEAVGVEVPPEDPPEAEKRFPDTGLSFFENVRMVLIDASLDPDVPGMVCSVIVWTWLWLVSDSL